MKGLCEWIEETGLTKLNSGYVNCRLGDFFEFDRN